MVKHKLSHYNPIMNIYADESGSINNKIGKPFIIALVHVLDFKKLNTTFRRFISSNMAKLQELDQDFYNTNGTLTKKGGLMFKGCKFHEIKGSQLNQQMKTDFVNYLAKKKYFELYYIKINNDLLTDKICENTARAFNYSIKLALSFFLEHTLLSDEDCLLQLDERNERTEAKFFLENYLNTEFCLNNVTEKHYSVKYLDSADNPFIQIADVLANLYYSELITGSYTDTINVLKKQDILKAVFEFPPRAVRKKKKV